MQLLMSRDPYQDLANAIVLQATKDYRLALRRNGNHPMRREVERFFRSGWYSQLTTLDGELLMQKLQEECR